LIFDFSLHFPLRIGSGCAQPQTEFIQPDGDLMFDPGTL
jgi:hypothetical protein